MNILIINALVTYYRPCNKCITLIIHYRHKIDSADMSVAIINSCSFINIIILCVLCIYLIYLHTYLMIKHLRKYVEIFVKAIDKTNDCVTL